MRLSSIHQHGLFAQRIRAATNTYDKLKAIEEYEKHMDEVENDMILSGLVGSYSGKTD